MNENQSSTEDIENARVGYQTAINLWIFQGEQVWARFNVMLIANSIIISVIGLAITIDHSLWVIIFVLPILGLALCIAWLLLMKRANNYQKYYVLSAREIEEQFLFNSVKTVSRGGSFSKGEPIKLKIDDKFITQQMKCACLKSEQISYIVIALFILVYIVFFGNIYDSITNN